MQIDQETMTNRNRFRIGITNFKQFQKDKCERKQLEQNGWRRGGENLIPRKIKELMNNKKYLS